MKAYLMIGEVLKPQGIHGESKIRPYTGHAENFKKWKILHIEVHGEYKPVPFRATRIHDGFVYGILGECANTNDAEKYRGVKLFVHRDEVEHPDRNGNLIEDLIGCEAVDPTGHIWGTLTDVLQYGTVDTWVFRTEKGTMMAPALLAVFTEVDPDAGKITVDPGKLQEVAVFED